MNVSCIINAHREGHIVRPTIVSVRRAVAFAVECGLEVDVHVVLDRPCERTRSIVERDMAESTHIHIVDHGDLAASRNHAVRLSNADYLAFVDGDDLWCRRWLVDAFLMAETDDRSLVLHPEYNVYFGNAANHVFQHVDMDDPDFEREVLLKKNYWTALSFAERTTYLAHPYRENRLRNGFGYEDWTWNHETIDAGLVHKVVRGTSHFIRRGKPGESLLAQSSEMRVIPRILDLYAVPEKMIESSPSARTAR